MAMVRELHKACGLGPVGVSALAGPLLFRAGPMPARTVIVPKYTRQAQDRISGKTAIFPEKIACVVSGKHTCI